MDAVAKLKVLFEADSSALDGALGKASSGLKGLGGAALGAGAAGAAAVAGIAVGLTAVGVGAAGEAIQGVKDLQAELGLSEKFAQDLGEVGKDVFKNNWGGSIGEAQAAVGQFAKSFNFDIPQAELKEVTEQAFAVQAAFDFPVEEQSKALGILSTSFQDVAADGTKALDQITKVMQDNGGNADDLLETIGEYSPLFNELGFKSEQFFGILQSGLQAGARDTDFVADAIKEFGIRIVDGSKTTNEALSKLGLDGLGDKVAAGVVTGAEAFEMIQGKLADIPPGMRAASGAVDLFGTKFEDLGPQVFEALSTQPLERFEGAAMEAGNIASSSLGGMWETIKRTATTALGDAFTPLVKNLQEKGPQLLAAVLPAIEGIGDRFTELLGSIDLDALLAKLPGIMETAQGAVASLMEKIGEIDFAYLADKAMAIGGIIGDVFTFLAENPAIGMLVAAVGGIATAIGVVMVVVGPFVPIVMSIIGAITGAVAAASGFTAVLGTLAAILTGPVAIAIGIIIGAYALWQAKGDEIKAAIADLVASIGAKWEEIKAWTSAAFDAVGAYLSAKWAEFTTMISTALAAIWTAVTTKWEEVKTAIADALESIAENLRLKWDAFLRQIAEKLDAILGKVTEVWTSVKTAIDDAMVKVKENLDTALANLQALWDAAWQKVWSIIDGVLVKIKGIVGDVLDWIADKTGTNLDNLKALWDRAMDAIRLAVAAVVAFLKGDWGEALEYAKQAVNVAWTAIKDYFERGWENVKRILDLQGLMDKFSGIKDRLMDVGRDIIGGLESGVKAAWDAFWSWCTDTFGALAAKIRELLGGGHSPIPTFIPVGRDIVEGLFVGTKAGFESSPLEEQIDLWMRGATTTGAGRGIAIGRSIGDRIVQGLTEALAASTMASAIKTWLKLDTGFAAAIAAAVAGAFGQAGGGTGSGSAMGSRESGRGTGSRFLDFRPPNGPREIGTVTAKWNTSGRGGHVAASKSNYWKVFVQKFGIPTESSAREVAERLGIPLPEWLEQMYKDAGGGSNNAAGAGPHTGLGGLGNGSGGGGAGAYAGAMNALVPIVGQVTSALGSLVEPVKSLVGALVPVSGGSGPGGMMIPGQPFPGGGGGIVLPGNPITAVNPTIVMPVAAASVTVSTTPIIMIGHATIETLATIIERKIADRFVLGSPNSSGGIMPFGGNVARQAKAQGSGKVRP